MFHQHINQPIPPSFFPARHEALGSVPVFHKWKATCAPYTHARDFALPCNVRLLNCCRKRLTAHIHPQSQPIKKREGKTERRAPFHPPLEDLLLMLAILPPGKRGFQPEPLALLLRSEANVPLRHACSAPGLLGQSRVTRLSAKLPPSLETIQDTCYSPFLPCVTYTTRASSPREQ